MSPARRSRGRSVRQNFRREQFRKKGNGQSGTRMVTHPRGKTRADISGKYPQGENRGRKAGQNNSNLALHNISIGGSPVMRGLPSHGTGGQGKGVGLLAI
jgi:hypothetical protein